MLATAEQGCQPGALPARGPGVDHVVHEDAEVQGGKHQQYEQWSADRRLRQRLGALARSVAGGLDDDVHAG
jgi:hypothetical protein